ncbi:hypothetical protein BGZ94_009342 [Podila epigama]|nr:hypothetical protein BGZ94_009342 [Podila epigama]
MALLDHSRFQNQVSHANLDNVGSRDFFKPSAFLEKIAQEAQGQSGRTIRRLAFLAHANVIRAPSVNLMQFLHGLYRTVLLHQEGDGPSLIEVESEPSIKVEK